MNKTKLKAGDKVYVRKDYGDIKTAIGTFGYLRDLDERIFSGQKVKIISDVRYNSGVAFVGTEFNWNIPLEAIVTPKPVIILPGD